jgi:hypothetical protein
MHVVGWLLIALAAAGELFTLSFAGRAWFTPHAILTSPDSLTVRWCLFPAIAGIANLTTLWVGLAMIPLLAWEAAVQIEGRRARKLTGSRRS